MTQAQDILNILSSVNRWTASGLPSPTDIK